MERSKVLDAFVVKDSDTGRSRGFGFVIFQTERSMNDAIDAMDGQDLGGRTIRVNPAGELSAPAPRAAGGDNSGGGSGSREGHMFRCYVGGLNFSTREASLRSAFSEFGELLECTVVMERDDPERSRGFGFVACTYPTGTNACMCETFCAPARAEPPACVYTPKRVATASLRR